MQTSDKLFTVQSLEGEACTMKLCESGSSYKFVDGYMAFKDNFNFPNGTTLYMYLISPKSLVFIKN